MNAPVMLAPDTDRSQWLGGSDIAAVMGLSPWTTPLQLYERKVNGEEPISEEKRKFFARRKRQERVVADMLFDTYGLEVTHLSLDDNPNRYVDAEYPWMAAEVDFEFEMTDAVRQHFDREDFAAIPNGTLLNGEIKTVHPFKAGEWGEEGSEEVPIHYAAQGMYGLGVTVRPAVLVAALFGLDNLVCFPMMRDDETIAGMRAQAVAFWNNHVLARVPPEPSNMDDIMRLFAKHNGRPVEAAPEIVEAVRNLAQLRLNQKAMDLEEEQLQFQIASYVCAQWGLSEEEAVTADNAILTFNGEPIATWKKQRGQSLDQKRLKKEHPEIVSAYQREYWFRVMRPNKAQRRA